MSSKSLSEDEQFIEWFLDEDDSIEEVPSGEASSRCDTTIRTHQRSVPFAAQTNPRATGRFPFWVLPAVLLGALVGVLAARRFELVPIWLALLALCLLLRDVLLSRSRQSAPALPAGPHVVEPVRPDEPPSHARRLTFEPLVRNRAPLRDEEPLSCILVEDGDSPGYRNVWVIATALAVNRSDRAFTVACNHMQLSWAGRRLDLEPVDRLRWRIGPYEATKLSAISRVWTDQLPEPLHSTTRRLTVRFDCRTTGVSLEIALRPRVWKSALRPAFSDDGPIHLVPGPSSSRRTIRAAV